MKKVTLSFFAFIMFASTWQVNAQDDCSQEQVSNNFENALYIEEGGQEFANDLVVSQNTTNFSLDSIVANIYTQGGVASVDIKFYEDDNGLPGTQMGTTIEDLVPSSAINVGTAFDFDVDETTFILPTSMDFAGTGTEDAHYWVQIDVTPNNPDGPPDYYGAALGVTTVGTIGYVGAFKNESALDWTLTTDPDDGVISFYGTCTYVDCPSPEDFSTVNVMPTSVELTWTELGDATEWEIVYGSTGFDPDGSTGTSVQDDDGTLGETITGLTADTDYDFYVRSVCSSTENSSWAGPLSVFTGYCDYTQTSNTDRYINNFSTTDGETNISNLNSGYSTDGYEDATDMEVSQYAGGDIGFTVDVEGGSEGINIWVDWNNNMVFDASEKVFASGTYVTSATGTITVPVGTANGSYRMRVVGNWLSMDPPACDDNTNGGEAEDYTFVVVDPPACVHPTDLTVTVTGNDSADISWTELGSATEWEVIYGPEGFDPDGGTGTSIQDDDNDLGVTITGLDPEVHYDIYVRSVCGGTDGNSVWAGPEELYTGYCDFEGTNSSYYINDFITTEGDTNINNTGSGFSTDGYNDATDMAVSQYAGGIINFTANMMSSSSTFHVGIWVDWNNNMTFEASEQLYNSGGYENPATGSFTVPAGTANGDYRMRITAFYINDAVPCGTTSYGEAEDYTVTVIDPPSCMHPTDIEITNITTTTADVSWTEEDSATQWEVIYGPVGFDPDDANAGTTIQDNDNNLGVTITDLDPETEYDVYVRAVCGASDKSTWLGPGNFTTAIEVICDGGPVNTVFCYENDDNLVYTYASDDGNNLNLVVNSGEISTSSDAFLVIDSNGDELYNGTGNNGDLSGLVFQSTGSNITVMLQADGSISCQSEGYAPIDLTVSCATCVNPEFTVIPDCNGEDEYFTALVDITDFGSATTINVSDNVNGPVEQVTNTGTVTMGPYPYDVDIIITVANADDPNCTLTQVINSDNCPPLPCVVSEPFCSSNGLLFENTSGDAPGTDGAPEGIDYGCLGSTPNPAWYFLQIQDSGDLTLHITQNTSFDADGNPNGTSLDVDFIAWGPFDSLEEGCSNLTVANQVPNSAAGDGCSYSSAAEEDFGIMNAQEGEIYILLLTNYIGQPGFIKVGQTSGDGSTNCDIVDQNTILACGGEEELLQTANAGQLAYVWYKYDEETDTYVATGDETSSIIVTETGTYKLQSYNDEGELTEEIFNVVFSPEVEFDNFQDGASLCGVSSVTLDGTVTNSIQYGGVEYQWSDENGDITGETNPTLEVTQAGTYKITVKTEILDQNGNSSDQDTCTTSRTVTISDSDFTVSLGEDQVFCDTDSYDLTAELTDGDPADADFTWTGPDGAIAETTQTITVSESGTYTVTVDITGCTGTDSVELDFNTSPIIDLGEDITTCSLDGIILDATPSNQSPGETTFEWEFNGTPISETGPMVNASDHGYGNYKVTAYVDDPDCATEQSINIIERDDIGVDLTANGELAESFKYCENDGDIPSYEVTFTATLTNASEDEVQFTWFKNDEVLSDVTGSTYTATYDTEGDFNDDYAVQIDLGNCTAASSVLTTDVSIVPYDHPCKITQGLSPGNNDGINDCLDLTFISDRSGIAKFELFNRYGVKVYEKNNYVDTWCGQDNDGDDLQTGTYFYILEMKNEDPVFGKSKRGWIYINRKSN